VPVEHIETLVIGGGQAGLVMSHRLKQRGLPHLVLERQRIAERWRSERWDGLNFQFPNWSVRLPDFAFPHSDPNAFATTREIVDFIDAYAAFVAPPIRCGVEVKRLRPRDGASGFIAETSDGVIEAANVVVATGPYQRALVPDLLAEHAVFQVHASRYRNPEKLPAGAVLVVGSGASGAQIAEERHRAGRRVLLSVGRHTRLPRRYRGHDLVWWLSEIGIDRTTTEQRGPSRLLPVISGAYGGHTIDFRRFAAAGMMLLGRVQTMRDGTIEIAADLAESLANGDAVYAGFLDVVDAHVKARGMDFGGSRRPRCPSRAALRHKTAAASGSCRRARRRGDLGHRLRRRFRLDRTAGTRRAGRSRSPARHHRRARPVLPRPAMAVEDEILVPVGGRRRCGRARRSYYRPRLISGLRFALPREK
jgi:putative flavoprotein involved in K+ transport